MVFKPILLYMCNIELFNGSCSWHFIDELEDTLPLIYKLNTKLKNKKEGYVVANIQSTISLFLLLIIFRLLRK